MPNLAASCRYCTPVRFSFDPESVCSPGIKLSGDRQIPSLLKCENTGSGSQTEDAIDFTPLVSFIKQRLLYLLDTLLVCGC